ncbi:MAG: hypothetical protein ACHP7J_01695 [Terriglobales bacterium]
MATGEAAGAETVTGSVTVRKCETLAEMQACFALQKEVWNFSDAELVPVRMFVVANKIGGHVIGAFEGESLVGFALALPGVRGGHAYLHSQMLAVRQQYRNRGPGAADEAGSARGSSGARLRTDGMDVRSAGNQERVSEY